MFHVTDRDEQHSNRYDRGGSADVNDIEMYPFGVIPSTRPIPCKSVKLPDWPIDLRFLR